MALKAEDLKFHGVVEGRKDFWIFTQGENFLVISEMDEDSRGNIQIFHRDELNWLKNRISSPKLPRIFNPEDFYEEVIKGQNYFPEKEKEHLLTRLRLACYIFAYDSFLTQFKDGSSILFCKNTNLDAHSFSQRYEPPLGDERPKRSKVQNKPKPSGMSFFADLEKIEQSESQLKHSVPPLQQNLLHSDFRICPYCNVRVSSKRYGHHVKERCPKRRK